MNWSEIEHFVPIAAFFGMIVLFAYDRLMLVNKHEKNIESLTKSVSDLALAVTALKSEFNTYRSMQPQQGRFHTQEYQDGYANN